MSIQDDIRNNLLVQARAQLHNAAVGVSERAKGFEALFANEGAKLASGEAEALIGEAKKIGEDLAFLVTAADKLSQNQLPF